MSTRGVSTPSRVLADRYELTDLLGAGGVAQVFRAHDRVLHRDVAVKVFGPGIDPSGPERERDEMRTLAGLSHPNLVPLHDAGTDLDHVPPRAYLVMALVDGVSLAARLHSGPLPAAHVRALGRQVAEALAHVHERGVVHRDVKPANVLLDASGRPFLTDFGLARAVGAAALTAVGDTVGTAAYLSPEQVLGEEVGPSADVYALGLVLLEALTGRREYPGSTAETALARLNRPPQVDAGLPEDLAALIAGMTALRPADRPTAGEVAAALGRATEAALAPPASITDAPDPTTVLHSGDGTRLLTGVVQEPPAAWLGQASARFEAVVREGWRSLQRRLGAARAHVQPWAAERRTGLLVAAVAAAVLLLVVLVAAGAGGGSGATSPPPPPPGSPGPARLGPDLARLGELVRR